MRYHFWPPSLFPWLWLPVEELGEGRGFLASPARLLAKHLNKNCQFCLRQSDGAGDSPAPELAGRADPRAESSSEVGFHIDCGFRGVQAVQQPTYFKLAISFGDDFLPSFSLIFIQ